MVHKASSTAPAFVPTSAPVGAPPVGADPIDAPKPLAAPPVGGLFAPSGAADAPAGTLTGSIRTQFPFDDLGSIETHGRWASGFALDGGSVRVLWVTARRVNDEANKRGFEISFFLQGPAIAQLAERMEKKGATKTTLPFYGAELADGAAPGKATLVRNATTWSPGGSALVLHADDKYTLHLVDAQPEALKGAVRIRVYGDDQQSTAGLTEVVNKLGLQQVFAPPSAESLERLALARFLWATHPELLDKATWAAPEAVSSAAIDAAYDALPLEADHASRKAVDAVNVADPQVAKRAGLATLLWSTSPRGFFEWAKSDSYSQHGILPSSSSDYGINNALTAAGIKSDAPEYIAAAAAKPTAAEAKALFRLGLVIKNAPSRALELLQRSLEKVKGADLEEVIVGAGIDVSGDRLKNLRMEEVYPGYFTPYDPQLPDRLRDKGARYLYSTLDNPERVFEVLTGGQKSSLTRFQEGKLVQGKSSAADFGTGGAFSIFTRLVTESAVENGKKQKKSGGSSGGYYGTAGFNNWGGSRPYKVIINRSVLGRLDWYGYNGDNYGRSTGLKAANHAEQIVETINKSYSSSNELMFPVGNAPSHIDFVVCENQEQKDKLLEFLAQKGMTHFNGKPVSDVVRVETAFFEHPDDLTAAAAVKEAVEPLPLTPAQEAATQVAKAFAEAHAAEHTAAAAQAAAAEALPTTLTAVAQSAATQAAQKQATAVVSAAVAALPEAIAQAATQAAQAVADTTALEPPPALASNASWSVQNALRTPVLTKLIELLGVVGPDIAAQAAQAAQASLAPGADAKAAVRAAVKTALLAEGKAAAIALLEPAVSEQAIAVCKKALEGSALTTVKSTMSSAIADAAYGAGRAAAESSGAVAAVTAQALADGAPVVTEAASAAVAKDLHARLRKEVQSRTKPKAEASLVAALGTSAKDAARAAALPELTALVTQIATDFNAAHPDKVVPLDEAGLAPLMAVALGRADGVAEWFTGAEVGKSIDPLLTGAVDAATTAAASADHGPAIAALTTPLLTAQVEAQLSAQLRAKTTQAGTAVLDQLAPARAEAWVAAAAPALASSTVAQLAQGVQAYQIDAAVKALVDAEVAKLP